MPHILRSWLPLVIAVGVGCSTRTSFSPVDGDDPSSGDEPAADLDAPADPAPVADPDLAPDVDEAPPLEGLYRVAGSDARGAYEGQLELRRTAAGSLQLTRVVRYPGVLVEGDRELWWVFRGTLTGAPPSLALTASLKGIDFITQRGALSRTPMAPPVPLVGVAEQDGDGDITAAITGPDVSISESWRDRAPLAATPLFTTQRTVVPAHEPPSDAEREANFVLYSDFHTLPTVSPYVERPEFKAAVHGHIIDTTDLDFYRAHPSALRVVDSPIDPISLREALNRANAFRYSLRAKAELFDREMETRFIDPVTGMVPDGAVPGATVEQLYPSGDGALWTGQYLASQYYRYQVTHEAQAVANVARTLETLLVLYEITGDVRTFARALRRAQGPSGNWRAAAAPHAHLEWLAGGNNDMIKGLNIGYLLGWKMFCTGQVAGYEAFCPRIRANAKHLADDLELAGSDQSQLTNTLPLNWLYAIVAEGALERASYRMTAEAAFTVGKPIIRATPVAYHQGIVDWSGTQLSFTGALMSMVMAEQLDLTGEAASTYRDYIIASHQNLAEQRFPTWHVLRAVYDPGPGAAYVDAMRLRLQEMPAPKREVVVDRRMTPEFCVSPYPSVPWKRDWMSPQEDRTEGLVSYPLFESHTEVMSWKIGNDYRSFYPEEYEAPGGDYLLIYWFARANGVLGAAD